MLSTLFATNVVGHLGGLWMGGFGWLFLLVPLFWIGVVVLIVALVGRRWHRYGHGYGHGPGYAGGPHWHASTSAEQTLSERFARGDIDETEYRARLEVLRANRNVG
ncbi:SHOCT domain-containing protein [Luethyella okanaganae]|uniref:SHOCT domain-containing protein n=1 Tax=Luethyella okanaganae TaxID=69372 RepID=A0ABW1VGH1_9MICO